VAGFSDGATYALALGRANGELFSDILAFSPGFLVPVHPAGRPRIYVSHGRSDPILPIDACSRVLVPLLRRDGYEVAYREFEGSHEVPPAVAQDAVVRFVGRSPHATPRPQ
jgi:predicted esterase